MIGMKKSLLIVFSSISLILGTQQIAAFGDGQNSNTGSSAVSTLTQAQQALAEAKYQFCMAESSLTSTASQVTGVPAPTQSSNCGVDPAITSATPSPSASPSSATTSSPSIAPTIDATLSPSLSASSDPALATSRNSEKTVVTNLQAEILKAVKSFGSNKKLSSLSAQLSNLPIDTNPLDAEGALLVIHNQIVSTLVHLYPANKYVLCVNNKNHAGILLDFIYPKKTSCPSGWMIG